MNLNNGSVNNQFLPGEFQPGPYDILIGRGKKCYNHIGNINFRNVVANNLKQYSSAKTKQEKSIILADIVKQIRTISPNGGFLKQDSATGLWFEVGDFLAREKSSQAFRDALHENYRSSNSFKKQQRRKQHKTKSSECNVEPAKSLDRTIILNSAAAPKMMKQVVYGDIFADITSSFDMDMTEFEGSAVSSHDSTEVTEKMDYLEDFSLSDKSDLIDMDMDDLSDSSFDNDFDGLFTEDYPLFDVDTGFNDSSQSISFFLKEQALGMGGVERSVSSFDKNSKVHTDYKAMFVSSEYDGFSALPPRNISVAKTA